VLFEEVIDMQATMFQPKGGMDAIPHAFAKALGPKIIKRQCEVRQIRKTAKGVKIAYHDKVAGQDLTIEADYCISTIPLPVLAKIDADFSPAYKTAIARTPYRDSIKIAWQAPRFWEGPKYQIYGGLSFVKGPTNMVWYPSYGLHSKTGVILGAYTGGRPPPSWPRCRAPPRSSTPARSSRPCTPAAANCWKSRLQVQWAAVPYTLGIGWAGPATTSRTTTCWASPTGRSTSPANISAMSAPGRRGRSAPPTAPSSCSTPSTAKASR
jgi:monoamine oxidase